MSAVAPASGAVAISGEHPTTVVSGQSFSVRCRHCAADAATGVTAAAAAAPAAGSCSHQLPHLCRVRPFRSHRAQQLTLCSFTAQAPNAPTAEAVTAKAAAANIDPTKLVGRRVKLKDGREGTIQVAGCAFRPPCRLPTNLAVSFRLYARVLPQPTLTSRIVCGGNR